MLSHHCVEAVELMFACWWTGAVFCPHNTRWSDAELLDALGDCEPLALLHDGAHADLAARLAGGTPAIRQVRAGGRTRRGARRPPAHRRRCAGRAHLHRRHHGPLQGRDADARLPGRRRIEPHRRPRLAGRQRGDGAHAQLPRRVAHPWTHALDRGQHGGAAAPVRSRGSDGDDRTRRRDRRALRADDAADAAGSPRLPRCA